MNIAIPETNPTDLHPGECKPGEGDIWRRANDYVLLRFGLEDGSAIEIEFTPDEVEALNWGRSLKLTVDQA